MTTKIQNPLTLHTTKENNGSDLLLLLAHPAMILNTNGYIIASNEAMIELYDLPRAQINQCNFFELCHTKNIIPPFTEFKARQNQSITSIKSIHDNSFKSIQWTALKINYGTYKNAIFIEGFDITNFLTASAQEENVKKSIIDLIPTHYIFWKDKNSVYLGCNQTFADTIGLKSCTDIVGKTDFDFTPQEESEAYRADDQLVMTTRQSKLNIEEYQTLSDGKTRVLSTSKMPLFDSQGQVYGVLAVYSDITERKNLELSLEQSKNLAEAANRAKTEFLANMRHDIRTPLSGIVGFSEILKSESNEPHIKEYANSLVTSSHALLHLMDEVLEAIRVSSGEIPKVKRKFDIVQTLEEVIALYTAKAHAKRLKLSFDIDKKIPHFVIGDKIRLHRIVLELVGNALNFTDVGEVKLHVELAKRKNRNLVIKIVVTDTGMGIPKEKQQDIYVQFKRLTPSYQGIYQGTGLGLYVVKQFIDELEGEIYVESEPQHGTAFTCLIPLQESLLDDASGIDIETNVKKIKPYSDAPTARPETPKLLSTKKTAPRVLVVEDNLIAQTVAKTLLTGMDCQVDIAANGNEALTLYSKNHYDLILMDIGLGEGIDGYEVTRRIRKQPIKDHPTPIIALTAHAGDDNNQDCIDAGMNAVLIKPLTQVHAKEMINNFISNKQKFLSNSQPDQYDLPQTDKALFQLEQFAFLDIDQALINCGNNRTLLVELLRVMIKEEVPADLDKMKQAFANQNYSLVEKTAHKIKGGAIYLGATRMKFACQYVERYWKAGKRDLFDKIYLQAVDVIEESCGYIKDWLEKEETH